MPVNEEKYKEIIGQLQPANVQLVAVSKVQSVEDIKKMYDLGQRDFGENYVQELVEKQTLLPADIRWHFIGHLQSNKIKYLVPFTALIQGVDSLKLLSEINKQAKKINRIVHCLLQVHIAQEETKFGLNEIELEEIMNILQNSPQQLSNINISGLMGMASNSDDINKVRNEIKSLKALFDKYQSLSMVNSQLTTVNQQLSTINQLLSTNNQQLSTVNSRLSTLSIGMSGDYKIAIEEGSNMVRIGSLLFGARLSK